MIPFVLSTLFFTFLLRQYLTWSKGRIDLQIEKMQEASFNTPGTEAPVPPEVLMGGGALVAGHFLLGRWILRMGFLLTLLSLILGGFAGVVLFISIGASDSASDSRAAE